MSTNSFIHKPVLLEEILKFFPASLKKGWILDGTLGAGGYTKTILTRYPLCSLIGLDCDSSAVSWCTKNIKPQFPKRLHIIHANFHRYPDLMKNQFSLFLEQKGFDIIVVDLGVSSPQLDMAQRGFSFYKEGLLDMRMDTTQNFLASDIVNSWTEQKLRDLFYLYGEIHHSTRVVKAIIKQRKNTPFKTTKQLADLIIKQIGWRKKSFHPATPYFLALRLKVNNELEGLRETLPHMIQSLNVKGRLFVVSFHSLEDRIVKYIFKNAHNKEGLNLTKKVIMPTRAETKYNLRSRSAKLRIFEKQDFNNV